MTNSQTITVLSVSMLPGYW